MIQAAGSAHGGQPQLLTVYPHQLCHVAKQSEEARCVEKEATVLLGRLVMLRPELLMHPILTKSHLFFRSRKSWCSSAPSCSHTLLPSKTDQGIGWSILILTCNLFARSRKKNHISSLVLFTCTRRWDKIQVKWWKFDAISTDLFWLNILI